MVPEIKHLDVEGLFGRLSQSMSLDKRPATILTGPNGSGKTHVLKILRCMLALDFAKLRDLPFQSATLSYQDGRSLKVTRKVTKNGRPTLSVTGYAGKKSLGTQPYDDEPNSEIARHSPPWLRNVGPNEWFDEEVEEFFTTDEVIRRYEIHSPPNFAPAWLPQFQPAAAPTFIATGRLDISAMLSERPSRPNRRRDGRSGKAPSPIETYVGRIVAQVREAKNKSLSISQSADRRFAARALDKSRSRVLESALRADYQSVSDLHHELYRNGLTDEAIEVEIPPGRTNPTERRILSVFLEDWKGKLAPLIPIHRKLQTLRKIISAKTPDKELSVTANGELRFSDRAGLPIEVAHLSSGEQHILALFTMMLFSTAPGSVLLVDEPEISLHAAWKHQFLDDLELVQQEIPISVVLASHSSALINGRWDLTEELRLPG